MVWTTLILRPFHFTHSRHSASGHFLGMLSSLDVNTYREDGAIDGPTSAIDSTAFPSPSSTLSGSSPAVPQSNELNFALQMKPSVGILISNSLVAHTLLD